MKKIFYLLLFACLYGCTDNSGNNLYLEYKVNSLQSRVDSLVAALQMKEGENQLSQSTKTEHSTTKKTTPKKKTSTSNQSPSMVSQPVYESNNSYSSPRQTTSSNYSGRCQAITKKGTQCKRPASAGSSYCWQH